MPKRNTMNFIHKVSHIGTEVTPHFGVRNKVLCIWHFVQYNVDYNHSFSTMVILKPPKTNPQNSEGISYSSIILVIRFSKGDSGTKHFLFSGHFWGVTTKIKNALYGVFLLLKSQNKFHEFIFYKETYFRLSNNPCGHVINYYWLSHPNIIISQYPNIITLPHQCKMVYTSCEDVFTLCLRCKRRLLFA